LRKLNGIRIFWKPSKGLKGELVLKDRKGRLVPKALKVFKGSRVKPVPLDRRGLPDHRKRQIKRVLIK